VRERGLEVNYSREFDSGHAIIHPFFGVGKGVEYLLLLLPSTR
jgi:hypothetical protein